MPIPVPLFVENPDELLDAGLYGAGAVIRLQSSATEAGAYADVSGTGSDPTTAIVAGTHSYTANDPNGSFTTWYRARYENVGASRVSVDWSGDASWATRPGHAPFQVGDQVGDESAYATLAAMRAYVRITSPTDTTEDANLSLALISASRAIDYATERSFGLLSAVAIRYYTPKWSVTHGRWRAPIDDLQTSTGLIVEADLDGDGTYETTVTDYRLWPLNAAGEGHPWTTLIFGPNAVVSNWPGSLRVTARWGWTRVPETIKEATLLQASRFYKRRDSPFGIAGSPDMGNELRLLAKVDPDVAVMVAGYSLGPRAS